MSGCKLEDIGCFCVNRRSWRFLPKPCQTLRRNCSTVKVTASVTELLTVECNLSSPQSRLIVLNRRLDIDESSAPATSIAATSGSADNGAVKAFLLTMQAATIQELSEEISRLMTELDTELSSFLTSTSTITPPPSHSRKEQQQQQQIHARPQPSPVSSLQQLPTSPGPSVPASTLLQPGASTARAGATAAFNPLALAATSWHAVGSTGLPLLSLSRPAVGSTADAASGAAAADAGSRAQRRRQNWRRGSMASVASAAPEHEAKFKTSGNNSLTILMGSFSKDHILSAEEEQLLAAAAQDFMQLNHLSHVLTTVLKRPPSMAEMARSLNCEEMALCVRMDCGNRARTLLAQKNYRLVVNIAKRLVRPSSAAGGGVGGSSAGGGTGSATVGDGGVSLDDAVTVGMEALMHAIRKFKPEAGYRLSTYATWWIRLHVSRLVQAQAGVVSLSMYQRINLDRLRSARAQLRSQLPPGAALTSRQLADAAGLSFGQVVQLEALDRAFAGGARSFEAPLGDGDGEGGLSVEDLVAQETDTELSEGSASSLFLDSEDFAASASLSSTVDELLASLDRGESELLRRQYGLGGMEEDLAEEGKEAEKEETDDAASGSWKTGVASGAKRLKLGSSKRRVSAARVLEKLRLNAEESSLAEWLELDSAKSNYAIRSSGGYARKSKG